MSEPIRVRDDDVLGKTSSYDDSLGRFRQVHEWVVEVHPTMVHIPFILVRDISKFPDAIAYVRDQTEKGLLYPEIHGLEHIDYAKLTKAEVIEHLNICKEFILNEFGRVATRWTTPWGANASHLYEAAAECGLTLTDCSDILKLEGRYGICQRLKDGEPISNFYGHEIFMHYWGGGARLKRVVEVVKHGSWEAAAKVNRELFK